MKTEGLIFSGISGFLATASVTYWFWSKEPAGTTCLALSAGLAFLIGYFSLFQSRHFEPRPEDLPNAEPDLGHGIVGHFSPGSYAPIGIAFGAAIALLGIVFGIWLLPIGLVCVLFFVTLLLFEHFVGEKAAVYDAVDSGLVGDDTGH